MKIALIGAGNLATVLGMPFATHDTTCAGLQPYNDGSKPIG